MEGGALDHVAGQILKGRVAGQTEVGVLLQGVDLADLGHDLGLLHRVDAQVGLQLELGLDLIGLIARALAQDLHHGRVSVLLAHGAPRGGGLRSGRRGRGRRLRGSRCGGHGDRGCGVRGLGIHRVDLAAGGSPRALFFEDDVDVGASKSEGADARAARDTLRDIPVASLQLKANVALVQRELRVRIRDAEGRRQGLVMKGHGRLHQGGRASGGLQVSNVALHRAQGGSVGRPTHHLDQAGHLDGITNGGPGPMSLEVGDALGIHSGVLVGPANGPALTLRVRSRDALTSTIRARADAAHDGVDLTTLGLGVRATHHDEHAATLPHDEAVGRRVKGAGPAVGQGADLGELHVGLGAHARVHAADDHGVVSAGSEALNRHVQGGQARRTRGVDGPVGAAQVEGAGHATGDTIGKLTGHGVFRDRGLPGQVGLLETIANLLRGLGVHALVLEGVLEDLLHHGELRAEGRLQAKVPTLARADHHRAGLPGEAVVEAAGVLQGLTSGLQSEQLNPIDGLEDLGRNTEGLAIGHEVIDEGADLGVGAIGRRPVRAPVQRRIPSVLGAHLTNGAMTGQEVVPEGLLVLRVGEHGAHADDHDVIRTSSLRGQRLGLSRHGSGGLGDPLGRRKGLRPCVEEALVIGGEIGDLSEDRRGLTGVKEARVPLLGLRDGREDGALLGVDPLDLLALGRRAQPAQVVVLVGDLTLLERHALSPSVELGGEGHVGVSRRKDARGRAHALAHQEGLAGLADHRLVGGAHGARVHGLGGHEVRGPHLESHRDALPVKAHEDGRRRARAGRVAQAAGRNHGEGGGIDAGLDGALELQHAILPKGQAAQRTHVATGLGALKNEARQTGLEGHTKESRGRRMEPGGDIGPLEVHGLLDRARGDQDERGLLLLEHREVLIAVSIGVQSDDAGSPGEISQERGRVVDQLRRDRGRHVRQGQPGHGARLGDGPRELRHVGDLSHGALVEGQAGLVGPADALALCEGVVRLGGREALRHARSDAVDHGGDVAEQVCEGHGQSRVLTQGQELSLRVGQGGLRGQSALNLGVEPLTGHLGTLELAELTDGASRDLPKGPVAEAQTGSEGHGVQGVEAGQQRCDGRSHRHVGGHPELGVQDDARGARRDHAGGRVRSDPAAHEHGELTGQGQDEAQEHQRGRVADKPGSLETTDDQAVSSGGHRGLHLGGSGHLDPGHSPSADLSGDQLGAVGSAPHLCGDHDRGRSRLLTGQDSIHAVAEDDRGRRLG